MFDEYHYFNCVESTNLTALDYPVYHVVWAGEQTAGRGRLGRKWLSEKGNLFMSAVLPFSKNAPFYSLIASVAVAEALKRFHPTLKWPNDVLIEGKKVCGILLEASDDKLILGIGVNILSAPEEKVLYPTTCLKAHGKAPARENLLREITAALEKEIKTFDKDGFDSVRQKWLSLSTGVGKEIEVHLPSQTIKGIFKTISPAGELILENKGEKITVTAGDVFLGKKND